MIDGEVSAEKTNYEGTYGGQSEERRLHPGDTRVSDTAVE